MVSEGHAVCPLLLQETMSLNPLLIRSRFVLGVLRVLLFLLLLLGGCPGALFFLAGSLLRLPMAS